MDRSSQQLIGQSMRTDTGVVNPEHILARHLLKGAKLSDDTIVRSMFDERDDMQEEVA